VPGSLDKKGGRRCNLLLNKRWNPLPPFLFNKPGTAGKISIFLAILLRCCGSRYGQFDAAQGLSDSYPINNNYKTNKNIIHTTHFGLKFLGMHRLAG
jgi:hypothetical protein